MACKAWSVLPLPFDAARTHVRLEERAQGVPTAISADLRAQITEASVRADWRAQGVGGMPGPSIAIAALN